MRASCLCLFGLLATTPALAAINPAGFQRVASDHLRLHEQARVVDEFLVDGHRWRRVTLVGTLVEEQGEQHGDRRGQVFVIDFTVDLDARAAAWEAWQKENGNRPGPQFRQEPDPPKLDGEGNFWAHVAPAGERLGNVNREAGAVRVMDAGLAQSGAVYVPVAGEVSFDPPLY
jgi:hypothetical protein